MLHTLPLYTPPPALLVPSQKRWLPMAPPKLAMPALIGRGARAAKGFGFTNQVATLPTITMEASTSNYDSTTIVIPADGAAGDIAVLLDMAFDEGSLPASVTPSGWTTIGTSLTVNGTVQRIRQNASYKILIGGDPGSSITGMSATSQTTGKVIYVFRKTSGTWEAPASINGQATTGDPTLQTVSAGSAPYFVIGGYSSGNVASTGVNSPTFSPTQDGSLGVSGGACFISYMYYKIFNGSPAAVDIDMGTPDDCGALRSYRIGVTP